MSLAGGRELSEEARENRESEVLNISQEIEAPFGLAKRAKWVNIYIFFVPASEIKVLPRNRETKLNYFNSSQHRTRPPKSSNVMAKMKWQAEQMEILGQLGNVPQVQDVLELFALKTLFQLKQFLFDP